MATPKYQAITVNHGAYQVFIKTKMNYMRSCGDYALTHGDFLLLCIQTFKKEVN